MKTLDIAVAGCGPGGLAAALLLNRAGHRVTMVERFPAARPVGSGLMIQPTGLAVLDSLGLGSELRALAAPIAGLHGRSMPSGKLALSMSYDSIGANLRSWGTHRTLLFDLLFDAVCQSGIAVEAGREVRGSELSAGAKRALQFMDGTSSPPFDLVVDAMGSRSPLSKRARDLAYGAIWATLDQVEAPGFITDRLDQRYRRASQMAGILPIGRSAPGGRESVAYFWSLKLADHARWRADGLEAWRDEATALWPESAALLDQLRDAEQFIFATYQHRTLASPVATGLVHIGDSWHATSPQLGQGANMALLDAAALGWAIGTRTSVEEALPAYVGARQRHIRIYQAMSRLFTPVFQSDSRLLPVIRDVLMGPFDRIGPIRRLAARLVAGTAIAPLPPAALKGEA